MIPQGGSFVKQSCSNPAVKNLLKNLPWNCLELFVRHSDLSPSLFQFVINIIQFDVLFHQQHIQMIQQV